MRSEHTFIVDLTSDAKRRSVSAWVEVPAWARYATVFPGVKSWGSGPGATVELKEGPIDERAVSIGTVATDRGFVPMGTAVTMTDNTVKREIDVRLSPRLRLETTTGGAGTPDEDGLFFIVFTDLQE